MPACRRCGTVSPGHARFCLGCGAPIAEPEHEPAQVGSRRIVTVLFCDLVGSTALGERLDPELVRGVLARYFAALARVVEAHGGTVEKYIGDAIVALFGLPVSHEDDALRAVRAAVGMRAALAALNAELTAERGVTLAARTGIATGEVVSGEQARGGTLATGDAMNTAARLEQAAGPGEVLLAEATWRLVREVIHAEAVAPVVAKGKATPVAAMRLLETSDSRSGTRDGDGPRAALIGRLAELAWLATLFETAARERRPHLVTVVGSAGVGKSRLVAEALARLVERATILRGRCLSYGEGITWWPLHGILHAAAGVVEEDDAATARAKLEALVAGTRDGDIIAARLASAIGLSGEPAVHEELLWAVRRTFEGLAAGRPLVLLVEDIHWADPAFLELLEHIVGHADAVPLLLVCTARPELRETHPGWGSDATRLSWLPLDGLGRADATALVDAVPGGSALPDVLRERVLAIAEGNPLFAEELVRMLVEDGPRSGPDLPLPPTIGALLGARLDALPGGERATAQRASVVGRAFEAATIVAITPEAARGRVPDALAGLVRRELVVADDEAVAPGSDLAADAYRFRHILIRDAAYERLTKTERAELHERFADWLEDLAGDRLAEYEAILGHHLERAWHYRTELHDASPGTRIVGERAGTYLYAAGKRARERGEASAAEILLLRAETLPTIDGTARAELLIECGGAQLSLGRAAAAHDRADAALALALDEGALAGACRARLLRYEASVALGRLVETDVAAVIEVEAILGDATRAGDPGVLARAWEAKGMLAYMDGRLAEAAECNRVALGHARIAGDARVTMDLEITQLGEAFAGTTPASEAVELGLALLTQAQPWPYARGEVLRLLAPLEAMLGQHVAAEAHVLESAAIFRDLAQPAALAFVEADVGGWVYRLAGDRPAAFSALERAHAAAQAAGDPNLGAYVACRMAQLLVMQGKYEEAVPWLDEAEPWDVVMNRTRVIGARARIRAAAGEKAAADDVPRMLAMVAETRFINIHIDALIDATEIMASLDRLQEALGFARDALRLANAKENLALAAQIEVTIVKLAAQGHP